MNTEVFGISTDSIYSHKIFKDISPSARMVQYPLVSDRNQEISKAYRVLDAKTGATFRATVIINPEGTIVSKMIYPLEVGRSSYELLRVMQALLMNRQTGLGIPANWVVGQPGIKRDIAKLGTI